MMLSQACDSLEFHGTFQSLSHNFAQLIFIAKDNLRFDTIRIERIKKGVAKPDLADFSSPDVLL